MRKTVIFGCFLLVSAACSSAWAMDLPKDAKKVSMEDFKSLADSKPVSVEIFDLGTPVTANLTWSWAKKTITGKASVNGKKINVKTKLSFEGDKACSTSKGEKPTCHMIYTDGNKFYEVRDDMQVHAVSTIGN
ncbi:hypothetical protein QO002_000102 [Pararhizobium capsulatum DSM 1112]|uniref:Lipoprotein n=1 Tax=Pararhizobium capsulatum DSM 1112 TaxID=1121113 RepID=A0ABU0BJQ2_9HYPH|nr:hypothetical protein [Pararhizobium capsulatum]MDQ0317964.1 hypothetical protein [Pararhizobium capsulatum DSM 1112]